MENSSQRKSSKAKLILKFCDIPRGADFHALSSSQVEALLEWADMCKYQKPKNAAGSRGRYFHSLLQRTAGKSGLDENRKDTASLRISIWNSNVLPDDLTEHFAPHLDHVSSMVSQGYVEGEVIDDNFSGWWKIERP